MTRDRGPLLDIVDALEMYAAGEPPQVRRDVIADLVAGLREQRRVPIDVRALFAAGVRAPILETAASVSPMLSVAQPQLHTFERRLVVRDLVPVQPMTVGAQTFVRELNPVSTEAGATGVPEGTTKPDGSSGIQFEPVTIEPGVLAVTLPQVAKQLLDDSAQFGQYLRERLPYRVLVKEESALLFGDGGDDAGGITGIANTSGVSTGSAADLKAAITSAESAVADIPDAVVVNKNDWSALREIDPDFCRAVRDDLMVVRSTGMPAGTTIVGAWASGALILEREAAAVELLNQHSDNAIKGLIAVRCEERIDLFVAEPQSFAVRTF